ncbi:MAG: hypothetical protein GXZ18_04080 [Synergistaceae bacterium]|nr:hypothetical protein [Synergistaceae bacterium]
MNKYLAVYGKPRYLGFIEHEDEIEKGTTIVAESYRGEELAVVVGPVTDHQESKYRLLRNASEHGDSSNKNTEPVVTDLKFLKFTTPEEIEASNDYKLEEIKILKSAKDISKPHNLDMKLIDVEFLMNKRKLFFYFSSEQRVDFRAYVRDLAREFKTRIELRQIGVRDEAKVIGGVAPCGQSCCCSYWLNQFSPICIKMVKEQNLALNPAKISGICGRLMCCMSFEHNVYHEMWANLPNPGSKIKTPNGNIILLGIELHKKNVRCYIPGRGEVKIPIDKFEEFKATVMAGDEWTLPEPEEKILLQKKNLFNQFPIINENIVEKNYKDSLNSKNKPLEKPKRKKRYRSKRQAATNTQGDSKNIARDSSTSEQTKERKNDNEHLKRTKVRRGFTQRQVNKETQKKAEQ